MGPLFKGDAKSQLNLNGVPLQVVDAAMDLGLLVDNQLQFKKHSARQVSKATRVAAAAFNAFTNRCPQFYKNLYIAYIRPILLYASTVFHNATEAADERLEKAEKAYTRRVFRRCKLKKASYEERMLFLDITPIRAEREALDLTLGFKIVQTLAQEHRSLLNFAPKLTDKPSRATHRHQLQSDAKTKKCRARYLSNRIKQVFNRLPASLFDETHARHFKNSVLDHV